MGDKADKGILSDSFKQRRARIVPNQRSQCLAHGRNMVITVPWRLQAL